MYYVNLKTALNHRASNERDPLLPSPLQTSLYKLSFLTKCCSKQLSQLNMDTLVDAYCRLNESIWYMLVGASLNHTLVKPEYRFKCCWQGTSLCIIATRLETLTWDASKFHVKQLLKLWKVYKTCTE